MRPRREARDAIRASGPELLGGVVTAAGTGLTVTGLVAWVLVRRQLSGEHIRVEDDAGHFAGAPVAGPLTAFAEAEAIGRHAREAAGGRTYADLPSGDPAADTVLTGSFMRASLFTSVLAFGVAAMAAGLGAVLCAVGAALRSIGRRNRPAA